jgi:hypothetical protein
MDTFVPLLLAYAKPGAEGHANRYLRPMKYAGRAAVTLMALGLCVGAAAVLELLHDTTWTFDAKHAALVSVAVLAAASAVFHLAQAVLIVRSTNALCASCKVFDEAVGRHAAREARADEAAAAFRCHFARACGTVDANDTDAFKVFKNLHMPQASAKRADMSSPLDSAPDSPV